jgi:hypothetical protein
MHRRRVSRRRAVSEATAEVIIMTVILIGFTIFIGVYAPFLKKWSNAIANMPNAPQNIAKHLINLGISMVLTHPSDPQLFHIIIAPINYGNFTTKIAYIAIWTNPPYPIETVQINVGQVYKETVNGTLYLINLEIPPHQVKTILDIIVRVKSPTPSYAPIPDNAAIVFADGYAVKWKVPVRNPTPPTLIVFTVKDTEYVPLFNYSIIIDAGTPYEQHLYTNSSGKVTLWVAKETWFHITIPQVYPPGNTIDTREYTFTWVSAQVEMRYPEDPTRNGPIIPPMLPPLPGSSFPSYTQQPMSIPTNGTGVGTWQNDFWLYTGNYNVIYVYIFYKTIVVII